MQHTDQPSSSSTLSSSFVSMDEEKFSIDTLPPFCSIKTPCKFCNYINKSKSNNSFDCIKKRAHYNWSLDETFNVERFLRDRDYHKHCNRTPLLSADYGLHRLISNNLFKENQIHLGPIDKILSSCWLNDYSVIVGTKCNKLILINLNNKKHYHLPVVSSRFDSSKSGGLYSIVINPSRTLLATNTKDGNDIAIYKLPTLDILYLLETGHTDFIFDICWLDDEFLVSGSRDSRIVLWKVNENDQFEIDFDTNLYKMKYLTPVKKFTYWEINKIRCLNFNRKNHELGVISSYNTKLHLIDALTMKRKLTFKLPHGEDLVCMAEDGDQLYSVGTKSHVQFVDSRTLEPVSTINLKDPNCSVRSLSFNSQICTVGTGIGSIFFYDTRNSKFFNNQYNEELVFLKTSKCWIQKNPQDHQNFGHFSSPDLPAIYTHQYDQNKTRLFTGGGPLATSLVGNYCALWE